MAISINIETLLRGKVVEWERLDFKKGWNPDDVLRTMCAFANDIHNWGGGYIVIGVEERDGVPMLPPTGIDIHSIDNIQKDLVRLCKLIQPAINILTEPVEFQGKMLLVIQVPGGELRPYKAPMHLNKDSEKQGKVYYIRQGSVTRRANEEEERSLMTLCNKIPYDDRINPNVDVNVLNKGLIADYLRQVGSKMTFAEVMNTSIEELGWSLQIIGGTPERMSPKNIGLLMFTEDPEKYIPYARIEIVHFKDDVGDKFDEQILHGPIHMQLRKALDFLRSICVEKVMKIKGEAQAVRRWNYPFEALEEAVSNAVYHKSYDDREPIEIRISPTCIEILNFAGPMPPLTNADLQKKRVVNRHYRNRRMGDFLKELEFTEGRSTGFPKIYRAIQNNDSPAPQFETDATNSYFLTTIFIHPSFIDEGRYLRSIGKEPENDDPSSDPNNDPKDIPKDIVDTEVIMGSEPKNEPYDEPNDEPKEDPSCGPSEKMGKNELVLKELKLDSSITRKQLAQKLGLSDSTIKRVLAKLKSTGKLKRIGDTFSGYWVVIED